MTLHPYGVIVGIVVAMGIQLVLWWHDRIQERRARWTDFSADRAAVRGSFEVGLVAVVVSGVIGARVWHVVTDFSLYVGNWWEVLAVWRGGLSIIGAVIGGSIGLWWWTRFERRPFLYWLDVVSLVLPVAQGLGRVANYVNQELYGPPAPDAWWAVTIEPALRLPEYEAIATYHPLFAYEMGLLWLWAAAVGWFLWQQRHRSLPHWLRFGSGQWFALYVWWYSLIRFTLEWWRLQLPQLRVFELSINQVVLGVVWVCVSYYLWRKRSHETG